MAPFRSGLNCLCAQLLVGDRGTYGLFNHVLISTINSTLNHTTKPPMTHISANDLKTKGISAIEAALSNAPEAIVSVRGKDKFVVMDIAHYHYLRECELDSALAETRADLAAGRMVQESAAAHLARLDAL